ncbi:putative regulatory protein, FmdB family [Anaerobiospirillum thomasii]|uniref:Putative regulatory protein, FmdB family n=1 Tax=Anaerobiospirillum thomasii TaxID=179995 RepID=A0A2X0V8R5_9GAMM|nr:FmdB family zinc ribbon protein [Anaerobiospirillum thomasii]SPT68296.1 putative regulatory protein, FmdB family [Anaerobiospirillum thomasii]SPT70789.1 putative regulatory protein, FmdB family [Anaerobiospirillum thomasii]
MPFYEYRCKSCGQMLTVMQGIKEKPLVHCDNCNSDSLIKMISRTSFDLKGGGWCGTTASNKAKAQSSAESGAATSCACNACPHKQ